MFLIKNHYGGIRLIENFSRYRFIVLYTQKQNEMTNYERQKHFRCILRIWEIAETIRIFVSSF
jgi:hypothetical protein